ncbi:hypothetical protein Gpo141_00006152 [Globisporangium polare]
MIHPAPPDPQLDLQRLLLSYEIVPSEPLPAFDPVVTVKQRVLSAKQIRIFNFVILKTRYVLFPMYTVGFVLRFIVIFGSASTGRVLGPIICVLQIPIVFQVIFALRYEYVKVLVATFEFWFLLLNATIWTGALAWYLADMRALILLPCFVDFVNMLLIEAYFQNAQNVARTASAFFLLALGVAVSLNLIDEGSSQDLVEINDSTLSQKDILVNTMATMITLVIRLSYRKFDALKNAKRASTSVRSIGYRCRITLRAHCNQSAVVPPLVRHLTSSRPVIAVDSAGGKPLLQLQFISVPMIFETANTLHPHVRSNNLAANHPWRMRALYLCGVIGAVCSMIAMHPGTSESHPRAAQILAVLGLGSTLLLWVWFSCFLQKKLLHKLCTSFDFLFLYVQLVSAHVSLCDMLYWEWTSCCGVLGCFLWLQGVLTSDALTPEMRDRLGWRAWFAAPIVLLNVAVKTVLLYGILVQTKWEFQNRRLFDSQIGRHAVQFSVVPFFFSREFTLFVWWIRILHRIHTRKSENELLLLLGNVEYDYQGWRQRQRLSAQLQKPLGDEQGPNRGASIDHQHNEEILTNATEASSR